MRAVAIRVTAETLAGGFVLPELQGRCRLDVPDDQQPVGLLDDLAEHARPGRRYAVRPNPDNPQTILGQTVTLAAKPEDAQKLALATADGEAACPCDPVGDEQKLLIDGATPIDLAKMSRIGGETKPEESSEPAPAPRPSRPCRRSRP